ncbi:MAG: ABC transporter substrate-binding protein [Pseudonocardia sp.]|uniref:ABC transporter substrate-binding protein n=1 Tax=unclassified Pseudonocardia TaxID=2619320 RepID=UPI00086EC1FE|nr:MULTISPECIES: ABC transporter substrate-binding protein [unclassified Pseudonocardia]MBN9109410.1 ABC transporter substrate-binding protein [Pseudonocardia sp.]ODU29945.1 MAG: hypothetical protein ABS80_01030 [Pseudonocardia sp. SCN 72-51]ODV08118.1 MAG: hypothetical protein ABT15_05370 [Pseudonocardia sp. SCN 73-27]
MSRRLTRSIVAVAAALGLAGLTACGGAAAPPEDADSALPLTLQQFPGSLLYISDVVAQEEGIFARNGLKVTFVKPGDGATAMRLLASGDAQGLLADVASGLSAAAQGQPIGVAGSVINRNLFQISARAGLTAPTGDWKSKIEALRGRTVAVPGIGSSADRVLRGLLREAGLDPDKDVTIVAVSTSQAAIAQFQQNALDALINVAPAADIIAKAGAGALYLDVAEEAPDRFAKSVIGMMTNRTFAEANPEVINRWVASEQQAIEFIRDPANRPAVIGHIAETVTGGDTAMAESLAGYLDDTIYTETRPGLAVPIDALQDQIALLVAGGVPAGSVDVSKFVVAPGHK